MCIGFTFSVYLSFLESNLNNYEGKTGNREVAERFLYCMFNLFNANGSPDIIDIEYTCLAKRSYKGNGIFF